MNHEFSCHDVYDSSAVHNFMLLTVENFEEVVNDIIPNLFFKIEILIETQNTMALSIQVPRETIIDVEARILGKYWMNRISVVVVAIEDILGV